MLLSLIVAEISSWDIYALWQHQPVSVYQSWIAHSREPLCTVSVTLTDIHFIKPHPWGFNGYVFVSIFVSTPPVSNPQINTRANICRGNWLVNSSPRWYTSSHDNSIHALQSALQWQWIWNTVLEIICKLSMPPLCKTTYHNVKLIAFRFRNSWPEGCDLSIPSPLNRSKSSSATFSFSSCWQSGLERHITQMLTKTWFICLNLNCEEEMIQIQTQNCTVMVPQYRLYMQWPSLTTINHQLPYILLPFTIATQNRALGTGNSVIRYPSYQKSNIPWRK